MKDRWTIQIIIQIIKNQHYTITFFHPATFECFNAVNFVAATSVEAGHVIPIPLALAPTLVVERMGDIFIVAVVITLWLILWTATLRLFNVMQVSASYPDPFHVIAVRT